MIRVITYGTFDLFHEGHRRLLERAKALGDYLIVGVTSDSFDQARGKLNVSQSLAARIEGVRSSGLADEILVEEYEGQKLADVHRLSVDVFAIGSDWEGAFDYLKDHCKVVYLERTRGVSSTQLRAGDQGRIALGVIGAGRAARRLVHESHLVSGVFISKVFAPNADDAVRLVSEMGRGSATDAFEDVLDAVEAVYIASPHGTHYEYARAALDAGKHVLCETPMTLAPAETEHLHQLATERRVVLIEAIKTAFAPAFQRLVALARSGSIGSIRSVDARLTKIIADGREHDPGDGGAINELATIPLFAILRLLGHDYSSVSTAAFCDTYGGVETFARIGLSYPGAVASATVAIGARGENDLVVTGTSGYIHVPAPWWNTSYFEQRFEDQRHNRKYWFGFEGYGLRYELAAFVAEIRNGRSSRHALSPADSIEVARIMNIARRQARTSGAEELA